MMFEFFLMMEI